MRVVLRSGGVRGRKCWRCLVDWGLGLFLCSTWRGMYKVGHCLVAEVVFSPWVSLRRCAYPDYYLTLFFSNFGHRRCSRWLTTTSA